MLIIAIHRVSESELESETWNADYNSYISMLQCLLPPGTCGGIFQSFCTETDNECQRNFLTEVYNVIFVSEEKQQSSLKDGWRCRS
jgi:hypothetical protein